MWRYFKKWNLWKYLINFILWWIITKEFIYLDKSFSSAKRDTRIIINDFSSNNKAQQSIRRSVSNRLLTFWGNNAHQHICRLFPLWHLFATSQRLMIIMWKDQLITPFTLAHWAIWMSEMRKILRGKSNYTSMGSSREEVFWGGGKKTISFAAEWIHLFLRLPSLLCFFLFTTKLCSVIYENAECSFVQVIINCCVVNYNLKHKKKLKTDRGKSFLIVSFWAINSPHFHPESALNGTFSPKQWKNHHFI